MQVYFVVIVLNLCCIKMEVGMHLQYVQWIILNGHLNLCYWCYR